MKIKDRLHNITSGDIENALYWISIITIVFVAVLYVGQVLLLSAIGRMDLMECMLLKDFGIPCPGCGGTRAIVAFFHGHILESIYYHALVPYSVVVYGVFFISQTLQRITKGRIQGMRYRNTYLIVACVILLVQYVLKLTIPGYII